MANFNVQWIISLKEQFDKVGKKAAKTAENIEKKFKKSHIAVDKYGKGTTKLRAIQQKTNHVTNRLAANTEKLHNKYVRVGADVHKVNNKFNRLNRTLTKTTTKTKQTKSAFDRLQSVWTKLLGLAAVGLAVAFPLRQAIKFESAMSNVRKVVDFPTPKAFKAFSIDIVEMSKTIPIAATGLADIAAAGGQFGVQAKDLPPYIKNVAQIAVAWDTSAEMAGRSMARLANVLNTPIDKVGEVADVINHLSNNMASVAPQITEVVLRSGQMAKSIGLTTQQIAAMGSTLLAMGVRQQRAGMAINMMSSRFAKLAKDYPDFGKIFAADPQKAIMAYLKGLKKIEDPVKRIARITKDFGEEAARPINALVEGMTTYQKALRLADDKIKGANSVQKEYNIRLKTTGNQLQLLKNNAITLAIKFGNLFLPTINKVAKGLIQVISALESLVTGMPFVTSLVFKLAALFVGAKVAVFAFGVALTFIAAHPVIASLIVIALAIESIVRNLKKLREGWKDIGGLKGFFGAAKDYFKAPEDIGKQAYAAAQKAVAQKAAVKKIVAEKPLTFGSLIEEVTQRRTATAPEYEVPGDYEKMTKQLMMNVTQAFKGSLDISIDDSAGKVKNVSSHGAGPVEINTHLNVGPNIAYAH